MNECYLVHGTGLAAARRICQNGFSLEKARGGLYGQGIYLAEDILKSETYCRGGADVPVPDSLRNCR